MKCGSIVILLKVSRMVIITFKVFKDKLIDGTKKQTIRPYSKERYEQLKHALKYQLYWGNPRNGGTLIKEVTPKPSITCLTFDKEKGLINIGYDPRHDHFLYYPEEQDLIAINDGFKDFNEMEDWFQKNYGEKIYEMRFMLIRWL